MKNSWFLKQLEWQIIGNLFLRVAPFLLLSFQIASRFMEWANDLTIEPYLINHGFRLYADIANQHNPLLTYLLAFLYQVFGYDTYWKVLFLLIIGILTGLIVKHLAEKTNGKFAGILAIWLFAMLWPSYGGNLFWFDTFLPLLYLGSLMFILYYQGKYYTWTAGGGDGDSISD